jgi:caspase domain-containing protein
MEALPQRLILLASLTVVVFSGLPVVDSRPQQNSRGLAISDKPVKALPSSSKRYAIVIGVDQYADTQITTLGGASNDARALAKALVQYAGFPSEQVTVLASDQPAERSITNGVQILDLQKEEHPLQEKPRRSFEGKLETSSPWYTIFWKSLEFRASRTRVQRRNTP